MPPPSSGRTVPFVVLHVAQPTGDGVARYVTRLVDEQVGRDWDVVLACPSTGPLASDAAERGARHVEWRAERNPALSIVGEAFALRRILRQVTPDLVHLHSSKAGLIGRLVVRGLLPTIYQPHGWSFHAVTGLMRKLVVRWEAFATRWTHLLICVSVGEMEQGVRMGIRGNSEIVLNDVDTAKFTASCPTDRQEARAAIGATCPTVLCVGRICRQKGQDILLEAWESVLRAVPGAELILVGDPTSPSILPAELPPRVRLVGQRDDVVPWLRAADVVVAPSRWEGQSVVILEAMACGKSIVATDVAGARESLGEAGAIVPAHDSKKLVDAIVARLRDRDLREREGEAARKRVEGLFAAPVCAQRISDLYSTLSVNAQSRCAKVTPRSARCLLPRVCAVVVTYGRRGTLCRRAAESALEAGSSSVIIVDNGAHEEARDEFSEWAGSQSNVTIVSLGRNTGSARGFGRGIEAALADGAEYLWLLDDDSEVEADAIVELAEEAERRRDAGLPRFGLVSLRPDVPRLRSLAEGRSVDETFPSRSSFLNFNVLDVPRRLGRGARPVDPAPKLVSGLPYAPYGGLFLPRRLAEEIGSPDERLVVYEDDTEFTHRVRLTGGDLVLVPRSRIFDQTGSWYLASPGHGPQRLVTSASNARVFYSVRNRVYFETTRWGGSRALYQLNKAIVLALILASAIKDRRLRRLQLILAAVRDGERGRLGQTLDLEDNL